MSAKFGSTIGYERRTNRALQARSRDEFIREIMTGLPPRPANMERIVAKNQGKLPVVMELPRPAPYTPQQVAAHIATGSVVVDTRNQDEFGQGHIPGSYNIQRSSKEFDARVGWITPPDASLVLVLTGTEQDASRVPALVQALVGSGVEQVVGYLEGGMAAWQAADQPVATLAQVEVNDVEALARMEPDLHVLDVREENEWTQGHIAGATHISFRELERRVGEMEHARHRPIAVVCAGGLRSSTAASILQRQGFSHLYNISGGMGAWQGAHLPLEGSETCALPRPVTPGQLVLMGGTAPVEEAVMYYI